MNAYLKVKQVKALDDFILLLTFSNGETRTFDVKPYLNKGIFSELKNVALFNTVHISFDTIEWNNEADFDPEDLYKLSKKVVVKKYSQNKRKLITASETKAKYKKN